MYQTRCRDHALTQTWLQDEGHIDAMLAGGWTLETVQDMPGDDITEVAEEMENLFVSVSV
jgi:hypothetical protein